MSSHDGTNSRGGSCEVHEPRLTAYLLDELASDERHDLEAHLAGCQACREELALLSQTAEALRASPPVEGAIAPERRAALLAAAREEALAKPARKGPWGLPYGLLGLAAAAAVVVSFVGVRIHRTPAENRPGERDLVAARAPVTLEGVERTAALADDTLALKTRVERLATNLATAPGATPQAGATPLGVEQEKLLAWGAPRGDEAASGSLTRGFAESESRRFVVMNDSIPLERGRSLETGSEIPKLDALDDGSSSLGARFEFGGVAGEEARKPEADRAVLYKERATVAEQARPATTDLYSIDPGSKAASGRSRGGVPRVGGRPGGGGGNREAGRDGDAGRPSPSDYARTPEQEPREELLKTASEERLLERNGRYRKLDESLVRENKDALGRGGKYLYQDLFVNDVETTVAAADGTHIGKPTAEEPAPGPDGTRRARKAGATAAVPTDRAVTGAERGGAPAPVEVAAAKPVAGGVATGASAAPPGAAPAQGAPAAESRAAGPSTPQPPLAGEPLGEVPLQKLEEKAAEAAAAAPPATLTVARPDDWKVRVDEFLSRLDRRPGETPRDMFFRFWGDNAFVEASSDRLSTFGADVDTASFTLFRAYLYKQGILPPSAAVRTEEFVNYLKSRYAPPTADGSAFAIHADLAPSPFAHEPEYQILKVGLKGREVAKDKRKAAALVFVVDTSGSMRRENRLELVKDALRLLVRELDEGDSIGIVAFDREARTILEPSAASETERILSAIATLEPRQNTNVAAGLELGYRMAASRKLASGVNRVILLSDGVANTGVTDPDAMVEMVRVQREQGIFLTCVGVGMENHNDALLERLADRGNGQCVYVDRLEEARKVFVENLAGTLETIAKDVKIQVEFDPARVIRYRLLGYENRNIADADFRDNKVDAGEVGAGHEVAALYELKLKPGATPEDAKAIAATIRVRYLTPEHGEAVELKREVTAGEAKATFAEAPARFQVSACAAELAEVLRESYWARGGSLAKVAGMLESILSAPDGTGKLGDDTDVVELVALLKKADALVRERDARASEVARTAEALKENAWLRTRIEDELQQRRQENRTQLDEILRQNLQLRQRLEELLRG